MIYHIQLVTIRRYRGFGKNCFDIKITQILNFSFYFFKSELQPGLVFELRHLRQIAVPGNRIQNPHELGVFRHVRLHEERRLRRVDARSEIDLRDLERLLPELRRILRHRDRMQVDDREERLVLVLKRDPLPDRSEIIADMGIARRLNSRKESLVHRKNRMIPPHCSTKGKKCSKSCLLASFPDFLFLGVLISRPATS